MNDRKIYMIKIFSVWKYNITKDFRAKRGFTISKKRKDKIEMFKIRFNMWFNMWSILL